MTPGSISPRSLVLCDGGLESLLVCAWVRERLVADPVAPTASPILLPWTERLTESRVEAMIAMASNFGLRLVESLPEPPVKFAPEGVREQTHRLLAATYHAASLGCDEVIWPICTGLGERIDLERVAAAEDTAWLVSRLVALAASEHGIPSIRVTTPFVQCSPAQVAELILDMDLDPAACWWWSASDEAAKLERDRWLPVLEQVGLIKR